MVNRIEYNRIGWQTSYMTSYTCNITWNFRLIWDLGKELDQNKLEVVYFVLFLKGNMHHKSNMGLKCSKYISDNDVMFICQNNSL